MHHNNKPTRAIINYYLNKNNKFAYQSKLENLSKSDQLNTLSFTLILLAENSNLPSDSILDWCDFIFNLFVETLKELQLNKLNAEDEKDISVLIHRIGNIYFHNKNKYDVQHKIDAFSLSFLLEQLLNTKNAITLSASIYGVGLLVKSKGLKGTISAELLEIFIHIICEQPNSEISLINSIKSLESIIKNKRIDGEISAELVKKVLKIINSTTNIHAMISTLICISHLFDKQQLEGEISANLIIELLKNVQQLQQLGFHSQQISDWEAQKIAQFLISSNIKLPKFIDNVLQNIKKLIIDENFLELQSQFQDRNIQCEVGVLILAWHVNLTFQYYGHNFIVALESEIPNNINRDEIFRQHGITIINIKDNFLSPDQDVLNYILDKASEKIADSLVLKHLI